jgi:hypothetical protein
VTARDRPTRYKQPAEIRTLTLEFADKLATGDSLTGTPTVQAETGLIAGAPVISGTKVLVQLSGGIDGSRYGVSCQVSTTQGDLLELDVLIQVDSRVN